MRIRQLDLLRYGHFTDAFIALPASTPDIHMVLGENEAGKSTAMAGIEDLLFGIPSNSPRNFLHEYGAMRVGATLEKGGDALKVRRRKGNKDTLLSEQRPAHPIGRGGARAVSCRRGSPLLHADVQPRSRAPAPGRQGNSAGAG